MNITEMGSVELRKAATERRTELGFKFSRQMTADECRRFLGERIVPVDVLSKDSFLASRAVGAGPIPSGMKCLCCGVDMGGRAGVVCTVLRGDGKTEYEVLCETDFTAITAGAGNAAAANEAIETAEAVAPAAATVLTTDPVAAAVAALQAAIAAKFEPKKTEEPAVGKAEIAKMITEAIAKANIGETAANAAKAELAKSVGEFIRDGGATAAAATASEAADGTETPMSAAKGDAVAEAVGASSWKARGEKSATDAVNILNKFLSEFSYFRKGASMRLVNTFAIADDKKAALASYCEVSQMEDLPDLIEKMKSPEFAEVCKVFEKFKGKVKPVNTRFAVFYGNPGGGKTYAAIAAAKKINGDGKCDVVPCSPSMDAADLLYAYRLDYKTGKRGYVPTALLTAMTVGRAVVLDEINLLPMEARMFLQDILDNKMCVHVMGVELPISKGFFVIGTMNLETGLGDQPLPQPLVDRACVIREFKTTPVQCAVGAGLC